MSLVCVTWTESYPHSKSIALVKVGSVFFYRNASIRKHLKWKKEHKYLPKLLLGFIYLYGRVKFLKESQFWVVLFVLKVLLGQFLIKMFYLNCKNAFSIAVAGVLFDLANKKNYPVKFCSSTLIRQLLQISYCSFYRSLDTQNVIFSFNWLKGVRKKTPESVGVKVRGLISGVFF